ncbi:putative coagulation factor 5 8 type domain protein [Eutypa lata UCREL1]|uniref:Putative coagulation factor 5 8 type domain protein n=1 Tax=Eutypa lata (strain UCR-EL1) TaxID=1287681 RepID=M7SQC2_EUTLA|nr:putative coagulation factor 5 8 type domain protein [Eutypa lata UCREL1]
MSAMDIEAKTNTIFKKMEANQFGTERYAILFKPGTYKVLFDVGFYTQVAGLGRNPDDVLGKYKNISILHFKHLTLKSPLKLIFIFVATANLSVIDGGANVPAYWMPNRNATCNFWRSFENFAVNASEATNNTTTIAVSQAAPLRRMHIKSSGGLWLFQVDPTTGAGGWASGGFMADSVVDHQVLPVVFVGDSNAPSQEGFPVHAYTTIGRTPICREKPYLYITNEGQYHVFSPAIQRETQGPSWCDGVSTPGKSIPIEDFYLAKPSASSAASINAALNSGKHVLFTPGIYRFDEALRVTKADTIILGLGQPSLIPIRGQPVICVADVDAVTVAGLIIEAGEMNSSSLLEVGPPGSSASHASNPTFLFDLTVRSGGATPGRNDTGITINSNDVVGDQLWLWRADHGHWASWDTNRTKNGIVVNGSNVIIYGLFNEHHQEYQTLWNGNDGRVYFYQSEIPYDPPDQESWMNGPVNGYASYKVADTVTNHEAWGLGIYSYFRDSPTKLENAIEVPEVEGVKLHHLTTVWLNGTAGSEISHIVNGNGDRVYANNPETAMRQTLKGFSRGNCT